MGHGQRGERLLFLLNTIRRTQPFRSRNRYDQLVLPITRNPPGKIKNKVMQFNSKEYDPEKHDRWRALTVKQPYANDLVTAAYKDENGVVYGRKSIEVRSKKTSYRGDVLICSSAKPVYPGMESGVTLGLVELYDVKPIKEFTPEDWENTRIPKEKRAKMELSTLLMEQIAKLFIMIFMGYAVVKMGLLKDEDSKVLSTLVLYLIVPCVILNAFQVDYTPEKVSGLELACIASLLLLFILLPIVNLIGKVLHLNEVETMSIYYSNSGNLIVPLVAFMLGDKWVFYACVFMGLQTIFFWTHCKKVLSHEKGFNLKKIFFNINIITIIIAITLFFAKIRLPEIITGTLSSVGAMIGPASMFVIGMLIGGMDLKKVLTNKKAYFISFMRLIVIPLIALLILKVSGLVGWNKEGEEILLIVFMAVISPVASTVTQMCQVYDNDSRYASTISVLTTLGAIVTMPLMVLVFQMVM